MYLTNQQAWDQVTEAYDESIRRTDICVAMFGQENLIGLTDEQRDQFWSAI